MGASDRVQVLGQGEWWRLFTATTLHGSPGHLIGNLVTFLIVGFLLEPMIGIGWFAAIYFTGGFAGAVLSTMLNRARHAVGGRVGRHHGDPGGAVHPELSCRRAAPQPDAPGGGRLAVSRPDAGGGAWRLGHRRQCPSGRLHGGRRAWPSSC